MPLTGIKQVFSLSRNLRSRLRELHVGVDSARIQRLHFCIVPAASGNDSSADEELSDVNLRLRPGAREKNKPPTGVSTLLANLRACIISRDLRRGKEVHLEAIRSGEHSNRYVANNLINMYVKCGSLVDAQKLFDNMKRRDVVSWNSLMVAYVEKGDNERALEMFSRMTTPEDEGCCSPSVRSFVAALQACTNLASQEDPRLIGGRFVRPRALEMGMYIHSQAVKLLSQGWDIFLSTTLVDMYSKCGSLVDACKVFDKMPCHNVVCWTALMLGYNENGEEELALELFSRIQPEGWAPNYRTFIAALKACTGLAQKEEWRQVEGRPLKVESLRKGIQIHKLATKRGFDGEMFLASTLVDMYSKCGSTADAREVFDKMPRHDLVSWTGMLLGYAENGQEELGLEFFNLLRRENFSPDAVACVAALRACTSLAMKEESREVNGKLLKVMALEKGREIHAQAVSSKCDLDTFVASTLIDMYAKCGVLEDGKRIFDRVVFKDVLLWNALMQAYAENGEGQLALEAFVLLKPEGCSPNGLSFVAAAKACISLATREEATLVNGVLVKLEALKKGLVIHSKAANLTFDSDLLLGNAFIDMYNKCGSPVDARVAFDRMVCHSVVSWNGLILGAAENGEPELALELFECMQSSGACEPNSLSIVAALKACSSLAAEEEGHQVGKLQQQPLKLKALEKGMAVHSRALANSSEMELFVANTLVDFYAKSGSILDARRVFDCMPLHTVVSWTALLLGYSESNEPELALEMFNRMRGECLCSPDALTLVAVLKACGSLAAAPVTRAIHGELCRANWVERDELVITTLLDAYGKCGSLINAQLVFDGLRRRDRVSYTALLAGYSRDGDANRVLELYRGLIDDGVKPNDVTFICLLNSCSHAGLVEEGKGLFREMVEQHGISPGIEHYSCMLDLLGRANKLEEAVELVKEMKVRANVVVWKTLLAASKAWKNSVTGKIAFESLLEIEDNDPAAYVLMASIYESKTNTTK